MTSDPSTQNAKIYVLSGDDKGCEFELDQDRVVVGRQNDCQIYLKNDTLSRQHAEISQTPEGYVIRDLDSHNGIVVNGHTVKETILHNGDQIMFGRVMVKFVNPQEEPSAVLEQSIEDTPILAKPPDQLSIQNPSLTESMQFSDSAQALSPVNSQDTQKEIILRKPILASPLLKIVLIISVILAIVVLLKSFESAKIPPELVFLKAGEERLFNLNEYLHFYTVADLPEALQIEDPLILRVSFDEKFGKRRTWILLVKALEWGECIVTLNNRAGEMLKELKFIIRGEVDSTSSRYVDSLLSETERMGLSQDALIKGEMLMPCVIIPIARPSISGML